MVEQLTKAERQSCLTIVAGVCGVGLVLAIAGHRDPLGVHGSMIIALSLGAALFLLSRYDRPEPDQDRQASGVGRKSKL